MTMGMTAEAKQELDEKIAFAEWARGAVRFMKIRSAPMTKETLIDVLLLAVTFAHNEIKEGR